MFSVSFVRSVVSVRDSAPWLASVTARYRTSDFGAIA